ncbi:MAG: HpsJ family protein [Aulosira sp. ZfuVER01]|nr:HpsJ family protein [Aulosira sp. ZfuVER01]MDZ8001112.1 HpsJ family protein [Aulosira sp. DedVER01a]MDZ8053184.1 HpsJ family protein [Aulosira sp. ZfuCHP01]
MTKSSSDKFIPGLVQELQEFAFSQAGSTKILRILGYGLLLLALFDVAEMLFPPRFMNPVWEFQTFGALVERVPVPLIGLALIFYGEFHSRSKWEFLSVKLLSWLTLLLAVVFLLLIPLGIGNTVRLSKQSAAQITNVSKQQLSQAEQVEQRLSEATPEQINNLLRSQGRSLQGKSTQEVKTQILSEVSKAKSQIKTQAQATESSQRLNLLKNSVKWNLGALVSAALFFSFWKATQWARISR